MSDLPAHLLAQLPDDMRLGGVDALLARAYGIDDRVQGAPPDLDRPFAELIDELGDARPASRRRGDDSLLAGHRVALLTNVPMHYRVPLFAAMQKRVAGLRVFFAAEAPADRPWVPKAPLMFDHELQARGALARFAPTVVVAGGFDRAAMHAARYSRRHGVPFGIWSGAIESMPRENSRLRRMQRGRLLARASFGIAYGIASSDYLRGLRPELPVVIGRNTSVHGAAPGEPREADEVRFLTVARMQRRKALDVLIAALALRPSLRCRLTIVGDGPERDVLRAAGAADSRIVFAGALPPEQARAAFGQADAFLFPTRQDVFGHVLVEAMAAGLPTAVASNAGAVADLCVDGRNALVVEGHAPEDWAVAIDRLAADADLRARLGARAAATVDARWTLDHSADAMVAGLRLGALAAG